MNPKILLLLFFISLSIFTSAQSDNGLYADTTRPYEKLENNLDGISYNCRIRSFTTFRGLDMNFSQMRFSGYLQSEYGLAYKSSSNGKNVLTLKFVPKVSTGNEYVITKYFFTNRKDILGCYRTENNTYDIIDNVEIIGTKNLIVDIFLKFWCPIKTVVRGYKIGEVAFKEFYSDRIVLMGISASTAKIVIKKGNMTIDYYSAFGIGAPKKLK